MNPLHIKEDGQKLGTHSEAVILFFVNATREECQQSFNI